MRVDLLVTGGSGLLGSAVKQLCPKATFVTRRDYDLTDMSQARAMFDRFRPHRVLHLAARVGGVKCNEAKNPELFAENVQINTNVLSEAHRFQVSRLVSIVSTCAFALHPDRPSAEDDLHVGMPFEGNLGYGYAKRMLDIQTRLLWQQYGCRFSTITPVTMYGPYDNFDPEHGHVVGALIHKTMTAGETHGPLVVWGTGDAVRQFVYVGDVARLLLEALDSFDGPETVIVAPDSGITIRMLTARIVEAVQYKGQVLFDHAGPEGVMMKRVESARFRSRFPEFEFTSMEAGLAQTVAWYTGHMPRPAALEVPGS